jgi:hypothetical protein
VGVVHQFDASAGAASSWQKYVNERVPATISMFALSQKRTAAIMTDNAGLTITPALKMV